MRPRVTDLYVPDAWDRCLGDEAAAQVRGWDPPAPETLRPASPEADTPIMLIAALLFAWGLIMAGGLAAIVLSSVAWSSAVAAGMTAGVTIVGLPVSVVFARVILRVART